MHIEIQRIRNSPGKFRVARVSWDETVDILADDVAREYDARQQARQFGLTFGIPVINRVYIPQHSRSCIAP